MDLALRGIDLSRKGNVVALMTFHSIRIGESPAFTVFVADKCLAVIANFASDLDRFQGRRGSVGQRSGGAG